MGLSNSAQAINQHRQFQYKDQQNSIEIFKSFPMAPKIEHRSEDDPISIDRVITWSNLIQSIKFHHFLPANDFYKVSNRTDATFDTNDI